jgi:hypothetical protein
MIGRIKNHDCAAANINTGYCFYCLFMAIASALQHLDARRGAH